MAADYPLAPDSSAGGPPGGLHSIWIDHKDQVWLTALDAMLKFTRQSKFLLQIGHQGKSKGNNDVENLHSSAGVVLIPRPIGSVRIATATRTGA